MLILKNMIGLVNKNVVKIIQQIFKKEYVHMIFVMQVVLHV